MCSRLEELCEILPFSTANLTESVRILGFQDTPGALPGALERGSLKPVLGLWSSRLACNFAAIPGPVAAGLSSQAVVLCFFDACNLSANFGARKRA